MTIGNSGNATSNGPGNEPLTNWGSNIDIDMADAAAGQVIWPVKAPTQQYIFLDSPKQLFIVSDNADDDEIGIGARTLESRIHDNPGIEQVETTILKGVAQIPLPFLSRGIFSFEVETSGLLNTNAGNIIIVDASLDIHAIIEPGEGLSRIAVIRCPDDKKGQIIKHSVQYSKSTGLSDAIILLNKRKIDGTIINLWEASLSVTHTEDFKDYINGEMPFEAGEFIFWKCTSVSANNTPIKAYFDIEFEDLDI